MNARLFIKRNSATILSFVAVAGVVATAITSANATPKAVRALDTAKLNKGEEELTKIEKVKTVLPVYLPTIITGAATVVCILGSNVLNQRTQASLSSAYAIVDQSYRDYRNKVKELYGEETDNRIIEAIAKWDGLRRMMESSGLNLITGKPNWMMVRSFIFWKCHLNRESIMMIITDSRKLQLL